MADFEPALEVVLLHEGGWSDDPLDPGGATMWGISLRYVLDELGGWDLDGDGDTDKDDIRVLTKEQAAQVYRERWWDRYGYGRIPDQRVATKMLDTAVNVGPGQAHRLAQRALNKCGAGLKVDGVLGPLTLRALSLAPPWAFLRYMAQLQANFYTTLVVARPALSRFLGGWQARARWPITVAESILA